MDAFDEVENTVSVRPGGRPGYKIKIGSGIIDDLSREINDISGSCRVMVVTDDTVGGLYLDRVLEKLASESIAPHSEVLPNGEQHKTLETYIHLIGRLAELDDARDLVVVALGGGVIGDAAGFAAATYRRGLPLIQVPTTLLACVDSSVGGKTGVDLPQGKNLVGSFYQPSVVVTDIDLLKSLPERELRAGMAEVIKYGYIMDDRLAESIEQNMESLLSLEYEPIAEAIKKCCELKAKIVRMDELDTKGTRAILNFGHTFAHAIEAAAEYDRYRHGEAVGVGMVCAADLSAKMNMISSEDSLRVEKTIAAAGLPTSIEELDVETLLDYMQKDKKTKGGIIRFVLLEKIGRAVVREDVPMDRVREVLAERVK